MKELYGAGALASAGMMLVTADYAMQSGSTSGVFWWLGSVVWAYWLWRFVSAFVRADAPKARANE